MLTLKYYYTFDKTRNAYAIPLTSKVFIGWLKVLIILFAIYLLIIYWRQVCNLLIYKNRQFTDDSELIEFTNKLCCSFQNAYSINYIDNDIFGEQDEIQLGLDPSEYQHLISKDKILSRASWLFDRYQQFLMSKDFDLIKDYTLEPFKSKQKYLCSSLNSSLEIRYNYKIPEIIPLNFEIREELMRFLVQINGEMIRFEVSKSGYILSGEPRSRSFTEYWDIALDPNDKYYIFAICEAKD